MSLGVKVTVTEYLPTSRVVPALMLYAKVPSTSAVALSWPEPIFVTAVIGRSEGHSPKRGVGGGGGQNRRRAAEGAVVAASI